MTHKEEDGLYVKWAVITLHPSLPSKSEQIARARAWGIAEVMLGDSDISPVIIDDVRKQPRTTNWQTKLVRRAIFIDRMKALKADGAVFFATPLCVGFGEKHAMQTIEEIWGAGMEVYVHSVAALYKAGDDMTEFITEVARQANAAHASAHRARNPKLKSKR